MSIPELIQVVDSDFFPGSAYAYGNLSRCIINDIY